MRKIRRIRNRFRIRGRRGLLLAARPADAGGRRHTAPPPPDDLGRHQDLVAHPDDAMAAYGTCKPATRRFESACALVTTRIEPRSRETLQDRVDMTIMIESEW